MARILSKDAKVMICASAGTPADIDALSAWDLDLSKSEVDVTGIYDANKQYVPGQGDCKGSLTLICSSDGTALGIVKTAHKTDAQVDIYVRLNGTGTGKDQMKIPAYITGYKLSSSTDSRVELSVNFVAASDVDETAQV